jgi:adenylate cyclase class 2
MPAIIEREIKLRFPSPEAARAAIQATGATLVRARRLQRDSLFDTDEGSLRRSHCTIRVRTEPHGSLLTFKGAPEPGPMKVREEAETAVADPAVLVRAFEALGLGVAFRYEKYREEYAGPDVLIAIDETPVGTFVEIEGTEEGIIATAAAVGCDTSDFLTDSYRGLFLRHRQALRLAGPHMLFGPE